MAIENTARTVVIRNKITMLRCICGFILYIEKKMWHFLYYYLDYSC